MGGAKVGKPEHLMANGKRLDGRGLYDFRPISVIVGNLHKADGSAMFRFGETYALAGVYGPRKMHPKSMQEPTKAVLRCKYNMSAFSTTERSRPGTNRRSTEISKVVKEALTNVIFPEEFPKSAIDIFIEILQADASTRCAGLNAASLAMAQAGIPMRDLVSCCSVGKIDGHIVLDVGGLEDNFGEVDMTVATVPSEEKVVLLQLDGIFTREEFLRALQLAKEGCGKIYEKQRATLLQKYQGGAQ